MVAVPGAEWRVPLWNTAGFEPRPAARLRLAINCFSLAASPASSPAPLSLSPGPSLRPTAPHIPPTSSLPLLFPQEHWYGPAVPSPALLRLVQPCYLAPSLRGAVLPSTAATTTTATTNADPRVCFFSPLSQRASLPPREPTEGGTGPTMEKEGVQKHEVQEERLPASVCLFEDALGTTRRTPLSLLCLALHLAPLPTRQPPAFAVTPGMASFIDRISLISTAVPTATLSTGCFRRDRSGT